MADAAIPITYDEVATAADALRTGGAKVTILAIREKLGRGSFSTVKKHLDRWSSSEQPPAAPPVPAQLESLWKEARRTAEAGLEEERQALEKLATDLDSRLEAMELAASVANHARTLAEVRLADRTGELERAHVQIDDLRAQRDRSETKREMAEALLEAERQLVRERWLQLLESLDALRGSLAQVQAQGDAVASSVHTSTETVVAQLAELSEYERQLRTADHEALRLGITGILEPLSFLPISIEAIRWQLHQQARKQFAERNARGRSRVR